MSDHRCDVTHKYEYILCDLYLICTPASITSCAARWLPQYAHARDLSGGIIMDFNQNAEN